MRARRRDIGNVRYEAGDASALDVSGGGDGEGAVPADVVVALHACGVLSDVAKPEVESPSSPYGSHSLSRRTVTVATRRERGVRPSSTGPACLCSGWNRL